ncbi:hypothetical protein MML48_1g16756 [Holotrichia oblita]|uniref:Uncharacterized protein n=1 Tax=Holotrichia oblita TaxID=644536 RepID=A0ACB9TVJ6_HOLOL|nr:hypothetical protein MML48_1g16756 [Holotrichia oblita]
MSIWIGDNYLTFRNSVEQKDECAERSKLSVRLLADEFAVGKSQIADLLKNKENLLRELENGIPVSGPVVKEKALEAATLLNIKQFKASNGWLEKCLKRHNIPFRNICDKSAKVDGDLVANWKNRLPHILANYGSRNIYNLDETGLFFRVLPTAFSLKRDKCNGGKAAKERLTVMLCTNIKVRKRIIRNIRKISTY